MSIPKASLARVSPRTALYARLHEIGSLPVVTDDIRGRFVTTAAVLRAVHARLPPELEAEDDLLEIADRLDILAAPIVVGKGGQ